MEFVKGGELYKHLSDVRRFSEDRAKFYTVQIVLALGYLHESKVVYRDLKPENILMSQDGYIRLADFGLAKMLGEEIANSFCGTPEYLSPEMILGTGHDHTLDWWTLGILLYEMVVGIPPFYHPNKHKMYYMIQKAGLKWPQPERHGFEISAPLQDLINKLLCKDKTKRLGLNGKDEILSHPWFEGVDVEKLLAKEIDCPWKPEINSISDTGNFDQKFKTMGLKESIVTEESAEKIKKHKDDFDRF